MRHREKRSDRDKGVRCKGEVWDPPAVYTNTPSCLMFGTMCSVEGEERQRLIGR